MEELGKYESIQDRIKRLTKNSNATTGISANDQESVTLSKFRETQDNRKQNNPQFTLSKKRQNSTTDYKQLLSSLSPRATKQTNFQSSSYGTAQPLQQEYHDTKPLIRNSQSAYILQKPMRQQRQNGRTQRDYTTLIKRNESMEEASGMLTQKYPTKMYLTELYDSTNQSDKSLGFQYEPNKYEPQKYEPQALTKRRQLGIDRKKSMNNVSCRAGFAQLDNYRSDKYQVESGQTRRDDELGVQRLNTSTQQQFMGRMLKKCRSGMIQRVPGKIMRNK